MTRVAWRNVNGAKSREPVRPVLSLIEAVLTTLSKPKTCARDKLDKRCVVLKANFLFTRDEKSLLATIISADQLNRDIAQIVIWRWHDSKFRLWASRATQGYLAGFCIDEEDRHLYIISKERVWSRLDLASTELRDLDSETSGDDYTRVKHQISQDGNQMAILRQTSIK